MSNRLRQRIARALHRSHWKKIGWATGEVYCGAHGRAAGWPCRTDDHR